MITRPEKRRNPLLVLPAFEATKFMPAPARDAFIASMLDLSRAAEMNGIDAWVKHKYMMAAYWRVVGVYAKHAAHALRRWARATDDEMQSYVYPPRGWTCFHCCETFMTARRAQEHFGETPDARPACVVRKCEAA